MRKSELVMKGYDNAEILKNGIMVMGIIIVSIINKFMTKFILFRFWEPLLTSFINWT